MPTLDQKPPDLDEQGNPVIIAPPDLDENGNPIASSTNANTSTFKSAGHWEKRGWTTQWVPDVKPPENRPDAQITAGIVSPTSDNKPSLMDQLRFGISNSAANSRLPEALKPYAAMAGSLTAEPLQILGELYNSPEMAAGGLASLMSRGLGGLLGSESTGYGNAKNAADLAAKQAAQDAAEAAAKKQAYIHGRETDLLKAQIQPFTSGQKALPAPTDPYIASDKGLVQRRSLLEANPQEQARIAGNQIDANGNVLGSQAPEPAQHPTDLDQLREQERLKSLSYTNFEHQGGVPLVLPDRPNLELPAQSGDTSLGFDQQTNPDKSLGYPLDIVPNRLRPRSVQTATGALVPDSMSAPIIEAPKTTFGNEVKPPDLDVTGNPTPNQNDLKGGTASIQFDDKGNPTEPILPSAQKNSPTPHIADQETKVSVNDTPYEDKLNNYVANNVEPAVPGASQAIAPIINQSKSTLSRLSDYLVTSMEQRLSQMGPVGQQMRNLFSNVAYTKRQLFNKWASPYFDAIKLLQTPEEKLNFVHVMDGGIDPNTGEKAIPISPNVARAVEITKPITEAMGQAAKDTGVRVKLPNGRIGSFEPRDDYWPHRPLNPVNKPAFIDELMRRNPGMTLPQAQRLSQMYTNSSEFFNSAQFSRSAQPNFDWDTSLTSMLKHIHDMSDIVARATHLGPGDIGNPDSILQNLIAQADNPKQAESIATTILRGGMDKNNDFYQAVKAANRFATRTQVFTKLGMFPISNLNNQLQTFLQSGFTDFVKGISQSIFNSSEIRDLAREYGTASVGRMPSAILAEAGTKPVPLVGNLVAASENLNRIVATGVGKSTAQTLFDNAVSGSQRATRKLQDLLLENDMTDILKQDKLTPDQLKFATNRFVEMTQQLGENYKLPQAWVDEPLLHTPLIFKRFSFQATKSIKDAIMSDPLHNIPKFLIAAPIFGELTGDLKSMITGAVRGAVDPDSNMLESIKGELMNRGSIANKLMKPVTSVTDMVGMTNPDDNESTAHWVANRVTADVMQSWGLGLFADMLQGALGGTESAYSTILGPFWSDMIGIIGAAGKGDYKNLARHGLRMVPFVGSGLQKGLLPTQGQQLPVD